MRVALLSQWHVHAKDYLREAQAHPEVDIVAMWDEQPDVGAHFATDHGLEFEPSLETLLSRTDIDGVIVTTPTTMHREVIVQAARHKKHVFTEKVLGVTTREVEEIFAAVDEAGVKLMLSLPRLSDESYTYAKQALDEGWLGQVNTIRCRLAHHGAVPTETHPTGWLPAHFFDVTTAGGGALLDLGAHPIYLANRLGGRPRAVAANLGGVYDLGVDDHATVLVYFDHGAMGILEAGFSSTGSPFLLELHGTHGTLMVENGDIRMRRAGDTEWKRPTQPPSRSPMPFEQWVASILHGVEPLITRDDMFLLTAVNEAAAKSSVLRQTVEL